MSLFYEIKRDIINPDVKLSVILRKLKVLAIGLNNNTLLEWVKRESAGYTGVPTADYPNYRVSSALNKGDFIGWNRSQMNNVEIHTLGLPDFVQDFASNLYIEQGIAEIERMSQERSDNWRQPWPPNLVATFAAQFFENYRAMQIWKVVPSSAFECVLSSVRDKILDYLLEMEKANPDLIKTESALDKINAEDAARATSILLDNEKNIAISAGKKVKVTPLKMFISYSHRDEVFRQELETHIKILSRTGLISVWHDRKISAGEEWKGAIDKNLMEADIVLLLISADFIASDYCYDIEVDQALENHKSGKSVVVPIILRQSHLEGSKFMHLQALPTDARAVSLWPDRDEAYTVIARGLQGVVMDRQGEN